ncbi:hypothetical protein GIB67_033376 [Kingdonia uniflora]|uniref:Trehalase n=1 Tax=Kingdonia uniflora TaxID=39325 RepID=A0A7J7LTX3_9MAGN|nr:hypothetical protein GIB67_033376 [Kingdonia uniflora]
MANPNPNPNLNPNVIFIFLLITMTVTTQATPPPHCKDSGPTKPLIPLISFLEKLQETALVTYGNNVGFDPKLYVDVSLKADLRDTMEAFVGLPRSSNGSVSVGVLEEFMEKWLNEAGSDLVYVEPVDYLAVPKGFLENVENLDVRRWALEVHSLWRNLSRKVDDGVKENPELHTLLPLPETVIVPGARFREVYYWDSYWVIRGLLVSKMYETAKGIVYNLISMIDEYGFVLNGARAYYSNRSQPPLLCAMVSDIYNRTGDLEFVKRSLPSLLKEYKFWNSGIHKVKIQDARGHNHTLSRYYAMWNKPRPESSTIVLCYYSNHSDLTTLSTTSIVPVDLNAYILQMELNIATLARTIGDKNITDFFLKASEARQTAMNSVFWNAKQGQWLDYWLNSTNPCEEVVHKWDAQNQNQNIFASNFIPLWIDSFNSDEVTVETVTKSLGSSGLVCAAGIATSLTNSGQQWDFPNGWAPLQHMIVEGLARSSSEEAKSMAEDIAVRWIRTNYAAYKKTGTMHEKYDVRACGEYGGGGEYIPQTGFGWSNGVVLAFLEEFGWPQDREIDC